MMLELLSTEIPATITQVSPFIQSLVGERDQKRLNTAWNYLQSMRLEQQELREVIKMVEETVVFLTIEEVKAFFNDDDKLKAFIELATQDTAAAVAKIDLKTRNKMADKIVNAILEIMLPTPEDPPAA